MKIVNSTLRISLMFLVAALLSSCAHVSHRNDVGVHSDARLPADNLRLLTGRAALIFKGVVSGVEYETDAKTGLPFTYVTFRQIEPIKDLSGEFTSGKRQKLRVRLFGGLKENGTMTIMTHIPGFTLGAVYLVFYTGGEWDVSPIVGGERGVFQVVKSRTLGHDIVFDYYGSVVVGLSDQSLKTLPLGTGQNTHERRDIRMNEDAVTLTQTDRIQIDPNSIYTEENVKRLLASPERKEIELERTESTAAHSASLRSRMLKELSSSPISLQVFIKGILEIDKKYSGEFHRFYSRVHFEGTSVQRDRTPTEFKGGKELGR